MNLLEIMQNYVQYTLINCISGTLLGLGFALCAHSNAVITLVVTVQGAYIFSLADPYHFMSLPNGEEMIRFIHLLADLRLNLPAS